MSASNASAFSGSIPIKYDSGLGPVLMAPFARDLSARVEAPEGGRVLELAAGTGILTEMLAQRLGPGVEVTATDLNQAMLDLLVRRVAGMDVRTEPADACALPFADGAFDCVASQFGVMFFPDKPQSFSEAVRVLRPGGTYVFNVWDSLEHNDFARCINGMLKDKFADDPPKFYETPFGFSDAEAMSRQLDEAGFSAVRHERVALDCTGPSVAAFCEGLVEGNPVVAELQALGEGAVEDARQEFCRRFSKEYGDAPFKAKMQAIVFEARK